MQDLPDLSLGLAGAEERLFNLQLDSGRIANVRKILHLRIDYLSQLNTPAMLLASADVGLLSTLSYSLLEPEEAADQTVFRMTCVFIFTFSCSVSLGASLWVLYTCNNLVNLATMSTLAAKDLRGVQGADIVLNLRMADVRGWYVLSLSTMVLGLFSQIIAMMEVYVAIPSTLATILCALHAIHADHETSFHFEKASGVHLDARAEYVVDDALSKVYLALAKCYAGLRRIVLCEHRREGGGYHTLGCRIDEVFERRYDKSRITRARDEEAKIKKQKSAALEARTALLLKTPSNKGPISILNAVAFEQDPKVRRQLLMYTAANAPANPGWWVLQGPVLSCFKNEEEWREDESPSLVVDLHKYTVVKSFDSKGRLTIALLPKAVLDHDTPLDAAHHIDADMAGRSWYICAPVTDADTSGWFEWLHEACESNLDDASSTGVVEPAPGLRSAA